MVNVRLRYALVREQTRSTFQKVLVTGEQVKEVESVVTWKCVDTNQLLLPTDIKYYYNIGNEPIVFTRDELAQIRSYGEPGTLQRDKSARSKTSWLIMVSRYEADRVSRSTSCAGTLEYHAPLLYIPKRVCACDENECLLLAACCWFMIYDPIRNLKVARGRSQHYFDRRSKWKKLSCVRSYVEQMRFQN